MTGTLRKHPGLILAIVIALLALAFVATARAGTSDTLTACVNNASGELKVVGPTDTCKANETLLTWNQQGPMGPKGDPGTTGATGPQGPAGTNGVSGYEKNSADFTTNEAGYALAGANGTPTFTQARDCSQLGNCTLRVYCSTGKVAIGGGYFVDDSNGGSLNITAARTNTRAAQPGIFPVGENYAVTFNSAGITNPAAGISVSVRCMAAN